MKSELVWILLALLILFTAYSFLSLLVQVVIRKEEGDKNYNWATVLVTGVCLLFLLSIPLKSVYHDLELLSNVLLGGFIGGFTNTIAVKMLFEKFLNLPFTGALLIYREKIIRSLAETVESHIINADEIEKLLKEHVGEIDKERIKNSLNVFLDEIREDLCRYLRSENTRAEIKNRISGMVKNLNFVGRSLIKIGLTGNKIDGVVDSIVSELEAEVKRFEVETSMIEPVLERIGTVEEFVFYPNNAFLTKHYNTNESLISYVLLSKLNMKKIVEDKLSQYSAEEVKNIVEKNIRAHLAWLEFYGVVIGCLFSSVYEGFKCYVAP